MKTKLLAMLLALVMIVSALAVLSACGGGGGCSHADTNFDGKCDLCGENFGHACVDADKNHACDTCERAMGEHADADKDHVCDYGCSEAIGTCSDADKDHVCDYGCSEAVGTCEDADKDHACDYGCDEVFGECADEDKDHACDWGCDKTFGTCEDTDKNHKCDYGCQATFGEHTDGDDNDHICDYGCGKIADDGCADEDEDGKCDECGVDVNHEHVDENKDHACDICTKFMGEHVDENKDHVCDYNNCDESVGACIDKDKDHYCDWGCGKYFGEHTDGDDENHLCDYGCGIRVEGSECRDIDDDLKCDICGEDFDDGEEKCVHRDADDNGECDKCGRDYTDKQDTCKGSTNNNPSAPDCVDDNCDELCDICKTDLWELEPLWDSTEIIFELSECSNGEELPSGSRRFLAGNTSQMNGSPTTVDSLIKMRNDAALVYAGVTVRYNYIPDNSDSYGMSMSIDRIYNQTRTNTKDSPDFYVNFIYDVVSTSLLGSFANLYSDARSYEEGGEPLNYFKFAKSGYVDDGKGYMFEYMKSLTLSKHKMYVLASDYFTDLVRAFMIVPVNIELLHEITSDEGFIHEDSLEEGYDPTDPNTELYYNSDRVDSAEEGLVDGVFNIDDFFQLVRDKDWTYDTLAEFSKLAYEQRNTTGQANIQDRWGFMVSADSGLSSTGMVYTSSVTIINREWDDAKDDYSYWYPQPDDEDANDLYNLFDAIAALFKREGIYALTQIEAQENGYSNLTNTGASLADIRVKFSMTEVLFGGIICVGSLEYKEYQGMKEGEGFGVVPVPLYRGEYETVDPETGDTIMTTDDYLTCIHNVGRAGGISATTIKFPQISAYLDYQSENSYAILNRYYDVELQYSVSDGRPGNVEMLNYIRKNVRSSFDKAYEDAIGRYFKSESGGDSEDQKWHIQLNLATPYYQVTNMAELYEKYYGAKAEHLQTLYDGFPRLPN